MMINKLIKPKLIIKMYNKILIISANLKPNKLFQIIAFAIFLHIHEIDTHNLYVNKEVYKRNCTPQPKISCIL